MFDDMEERTANWPQDRFAAISKLFEAFNRK